VRASDYLERKLQTTLTHHVEGMINREAQIVSFPSGHTVLWEGDTALYLYYIIKGAVRGYYIDRKGNGMTKCFCTENDFFSTEGFRTSAPATFTIECLEGCQCLRLPYKSLMYIVVSDKRVSDSISCLFQAEVSKQEDRNKKLMLLNAEERYLVFCNDYPHLHKRIALKYIASYIGVHAASLSRIRKKVDKN
jgi:CRP-like cAMP-binding protein